MTYSLDFRKKVLAVRKRENLSMMEVSKRFDIGVATVMRWCNRLEAVTTRDVTPHRLPREALRNDVKIYPDSYHYERAKRLGVGKSTVGQALRKLGITYKKNSSTSKSKTRRKNKI